MADDDVAVHGELLNTKIMTPREAADTIARLDSFEEGLRRRTEGTLWMVWGLVFAAIFVSFYAFDNGVRHGEKPTAIQMLEITFLPWVGWVAAGAAISGAIWRSAAMHDAGVSARSRFFRTLLVMGTVMISALLIVAASWFAGDVLGISTGNFVNPLLVLGLITLAIGGFNALRLTSSGRQVALATGVVQAIGGIIFGLVSAPGPYPVAAVWMGVFCGGTWILGGLYETLRG